MPILIGFIKMLSCLPLHRLYDIGAVLSFVLHRVVGYRREVVRTNLHKAFPALSRMELAAIEADFYRYLADQVMETIKLWRITEKELMERVVFTNPALLAAYESNGSNVIIMMGHSGNWEWAGCATGLRFGFKMLPVYRRLRNDSFDRFYFQMRSLFGAMPVRDKEAATLIPRQPTPHAVAMLADQRPGRDNGWWTVFLNQHTPFFRGSEILAKRLGHDVVFAHVRRAGRGRYAIHLEKAPDGWRDQRFALTKAFVAFLEREVTADKANWLWSHKRWKFKPDDSSKWI